LRKDDLIYLKCPACKGDLVIRDIQREHDGRIETGTLGCVICGQEYPILRHVPRFVPMENYASSFGLEWSLHARTQYDSYTGIHLSETRFFEETKWPRDLTGQMILEAGSGSGRFTEPAASTGAKIISMDYSYAVDANYASNGQRDNVLIVQGDIYRMPFPENCFDKIFCFGVLQHTPHVKEAFMTLPRYLKPGGSLVIDVYIRETGVIGTLKQLLKTKYWVRPLTTRLPPEGLYRWCQWYVTHMWPVATLINRCIPRAGRKINHLLLVADYRGKFDLPEAILKEWAVLDTFDKLAPAYDSPQTIQTIRSWFDEAGMSDVEVHRGYNGVEGRGTKHGSSI